MVTLSGLQSAVQHALEESSDPRPRGRGSGKVLKDQHRAKQLATFLTTQSVAMAKDAKPLIDIELLVAVTTDDVNHSTAFGAGQKRAFANGALAAIEDALYFFLKK